MFLKSVRNDALQIVAKVVVFFPGVLLLCIISTKMEKEELATTERFWSLDYGGRFTSLHCHSAITHPLHATF